MIQRIFSRLKRTLQDPWNNLFANLTILNARFPLQEEHQLNQSSGWHITCTKCHLYWEVRCSLLTIASQRLPISTLHGILLLRLALALATSFLNDSWNGPSLLLISTTSWFQYCHEVRVHTGNLSTLEIANPVGLYWIGDWKFIRLISDTVFFL